MAVGAVPWEEHRSSFPQAAAELGVGPQSTSRSLDEGVSHPPSFPHENTARRPPWALGRTGREQERQQVAVGAAVAAPPGEVGVSTSVAAAVGLAVLRRRKWKGLTKEALPAQRGGGDTPPESPAVLEA